MGNNGSKLIRFGILQMTIKAPSNEEILFAVSEVFDRVRLGHTGNLLNALVVDKAMHEGYSVINYVVDYEMQELCDFVKLSSGSYRRGPSSGSDQGR